MTKKIVLAVAVGPSTKDAEFDVPTPDLRNARPYIKGLVEWLGDQNKTNPGPPPPNLPRYVCGTDYKIVYRERDVGNLAQAFQNVTPDLIFCMSTSVAKAAQTAAPATMPIVAIVSEPQSENLNANVRGVSAKRDGGAVQQLREFIRLSPQSNPSKSFERIFVLHRKGYNPSLRALNAIIDEDSITSVVVPDSATIAQVEAIVRGIPEDQRHGVLVLPADRFFGWAREITVWTRSMRTFWSAPDLPLDAFGGFGFPQETCGRHMARVVAMIWKNQQEGTPLPTGFSNIPGNRVGRPDNPVELP
jgi:hypothetical protein